MKSLTFLILLSCTILFARDIRFAHLTINDGFSENMCQDVIVDSKGYLWKAGFYFLDRYNGYEFESYKVGDLERNFAGNNIYGLFIDRNENLWVTTNKGVLRYSYENQSFSHYSFNNSGRLITDDPSGIVWVVSHNKLIKIHPTDTSFVESTQIDVGFCFSVNSIGDEIWLARTTDILIFNTKTFETKSIHPLGSNYKYYRNITVDKKGNIWSFDRENLYYINSMTHNKRVYSFSTTLPELMANSGSLLFKNDSEIWITSHSGCAIYDLKNYNTTIISHNPDNQYSIGSDFIISSYIDNNDIVWLATHQNGLSYYDYHRKPFYHLARIPFTDNSLVSNVVYTTYADQNDILWIGTEDGLNSYNRQTNQFTHYNIGKENKRIDVLVSDKKGNIYITNRNDNYLTVYNPTTGRKVNYPFPSQGIVRSMYINKFDEILISRVNSSEPLLYFDINQKEFRTFAIDISNKSASNIYHIFEDSKGLIWMGVDNGCLVYSNLKQKFQFIPLKIKGTDKIVTGTFIHFIFEDSKGRIWLGSAHGLFMLDSRSTFEFVQYDSKNELPTDVIINIQEDNEGNLWIATDKGICRFNPETKEHQVYSKSDGIKGLGFEHFAISKFSNGEMAFGGNNGIAIFNPANITGNPIIPKIRFTNLKISNNEIKPGELINGRTILTKSMGETSQIFLSHKERNISIEYAALQFSSPAKNKYAYKLQGFEDQWNYVNTKREAVYTNLPFGSYTFLVKAANKDGLWNETPIALGIDVYPPWWSSKVAFIGYFVVLMGLFYAIVKVVLYQKRLKDTIKLEKLEKQKEQELHQMKIGFFTDISHEFKTPLTLIISPLEQILNESAINQDVKNKLSRIQQNSKRLHRLINQLIDFRKIEHDIFKLNKSVFDIISVSRSVINTFKDLAHSNDLSIYFRHSNEKCFVNLDLNQYENVLYNLLSNSIKYNKPGGNVIVTIEQSQTSGRILLIIEDTGIGITEEKQKRLFEKFDSENQETLIKYERSSGLGLSFTKSIIEMHKGDIEIKSNPGKGTKFIVSWPSMKTHQISQRLNEIEKIYDGHVEYKQKASSNNDKNTPLILLVEDNKELREYIKTLLWKDYRIEEAENGKIAHEIAIQKDPDLIITDLVMPAMDGISLCKALRVNILTSHIPIIILSAKDDLETKLKGYEQGIEAYVEKPFEPEILTTRISSILNNRRMLKELFSKPIDNPTELEELSVVDKNFLQQLDEIIDDNISDPDFGVDMLRNKINLTKKQLYKKLEALSGLTPRDYIRQRRLSKASLLIQDESLNFSEIAYSIGFSAPSNFNRSFKSFFGVSPSDYRRKKLKKTNIT